MTQTNRCHGFGALGHASQQSFVGIPLWICILGRSSRKPPLCSIQPYLTLHLHVFQPFWAVKLMKWHRPSDVTVSVPWAGKMAGTLWEYYFQTPELCKLKPLPMMMPYVHSKRKLLALDHYISILCYLLIFPSCPLAVGPRTLWLLAGPLLRCSHASCCIPKQVFGLARSGHIASTHCAHVGALPSWPCGGTLDPGHASTWVLEARARLQGVFCFSAILFIYSARSSEKYVFEISCHKTNLGVAEHYLPATALGPQHCLFFEKSCTYSSLSYCDRVSWIQRYTISNLTLHVVTLTFHCQALPPRTFKSLTLLCSDLTAFGFPTAYRIDENTSPRHPPLQSCSFDQN